MVNSIKNFNLTHCQNVTILKGLSETYFNLHLSFSIVKIQNIFISSNNFNEKMQYIDTVCHLKKSFHSSIVILL